MSRGLGDVYKRQELGSQGEFSTTDKRPVESEPGKAQKGHQDRCRS